MKPAPKVDTLTSLPIALRTARLSSGKDIATLARETKIAKHYIVAFEESKYDSIRHTVYSMGLLRRYALNLGIDVAWASEQYLQIRGPLARTKQRLRPRRINSGIVASRWFFSGIIAVITLAVVGYVVWQAASLASAPRLEVIEPTGDMQLRGTNLAINGITLPGAELTVNSKPVYVGDDGKFNTSITLPEGLNTLTITARNKVGRTTTVVRNILVSN